MWPKGVGPGPTIWITEGPLKADFVAERLGLTTLGITGVSTWRHALLEVKVIGP